MFANNNTVVSFDGVKMKDFRAYWDAVRRGNWKGRDAFFAKVVKSWPYDLDPANAESYGMLEFKQYTSVQMAINASSKQVSKLSVRNLMEKDSQ